ncbi:efflux RND transporter periplasmic adaptor subunit, partial [Candidatus Hydrogenedentota bacterium]
MIIQGTLRAIEEVEMLAEAEGKFYLSTSTGGKRKLREGDKIEKDQVIAVLESEELDNQLRMAKTSLSTAKLNLQSALRNLEKAEKLYAEGVLPRADLDQLVDSEAMAHNQVSEAELGCENAKLQHDRLEIDAPMAGILTELRDIVDGCRVRPGEKICSVMSYEKIKAEINVGPGDAKKIIVGQSVELYNYAYEETFMAVVSDISPTVDPSTRAFVVEVCLSNKDDRLRPGMFAKAEIVVDSRNSALIVSRRLVLKREGKDVVFVVEEDVAAAREVKLGIEGKEQVEILSGIAEGEKLISAGYETLKDGAKIKIVGDGKTDEEDEQAGHKEWSEDEEQADEQAEVAA